jgi:hypothetical protein
MIHHHHVLGNVLVLRASVYCRKRPDQEVRTWLGRSQWPSVNVKGRGKSVTGNLQLWQVVRLLGAHAGARQWLWSYCIVKMRSHKNLKKRHHCTNKVTSLPIHLQISITNLYYLPPSSPSATSSGRGEYRIIQTGSCPVVHQAKNQNYREWP